MMSFPISFIGIACVFAYALFGASLEVMLNPHSVILVGLGTCFIFGLATPSEEIFGLFRCLKKVFTRDLSLESLNTHLLSLMKNRSQTHGTEHPLIKYAQDLWEQGLDSEMFSILLTQRLEELNHSTEQAVATLRNLAKYPPALGMTGTVIGLVALFSKLSAENQANLGPNLALAMTATFYGLILSNACLMPLADRLYVIHLSNMKKNDHIYRVLMLIHQGEAESLISEKLNAAA